MWEVGERFQRERMYVYLWPMHGLPCGAGGKESTYNSGDVGSIPGLGRCPGGRHGNPGQYSCLETPHESRSLAGGSR